MDPQRHTWRIQGIPLDFSREHLTDILRDHPDLQLGNGTDGDNVANSAEILTVSQDHGGRHQVATVRFCHHPKKLTVGNGKRLRLTTSDFRAGRDRPSLPAGITIDDHFHGITVLFSPVSEKHRADILVVPGLGSHPFGSFVSKEDGHMWLCSELVRDAPGARIMTYGYGSTLQASQSVARLGDLARSLQIPMCDLLRSEPRKPLILIAHSLGGLLVKEALIQTLESQSDSGLLELVKGCIFFGVPNDGMDITSLVPMVKDGPNRLLLQSLENMNPEILRIQKKRFSAVLDYASLELFCFFETELSPTAVKDPSTGRYKMNGTRRLLLTQASATSCLPAEMSLELSAPLARTHSDLVKFALYDDEYDKVSSHIKRIYTSSVKGNHMNREKIMESLYFQEMSYRKRQIYEDDSGSLEWIWNEGSFLSWLKSPQCLFWISGKPGSGKSTLMKYIRNSSQLKSYLDANHSTLAWVVIDFFFDFRSEDRIANSFEGLLRSLLLQLIHEMPEKSDAVLGIALDGFGPKQEVEWTRPALLQAVKAVILTADTNMCIFVDGLDEYGGSYLELIELFRGIESATGKARATVKICLASRPEALFIESFKDLGSICMQRYNVSSIRQYVAEKFRVVLQYHSEAEDVCWLIDHIVKNAEGVFLWAQFATQITIEGIADGENFSNLQKFLLDLPSDLEAVYDRMLHCLKPRQFQEAYVILSLVSHATLPLTLQALHAAVCLATGRQDSAGMISANTGIYDLTSAKTLSDFGKWARSYTCGLVEVVHTSGPGDLKTNEVRLIHRTVKTFLDRPEALAFLGVRKDDVLVDPELLWVQICAEVLKQFGSRRYSYLGFYAATAWASHARKAEETRPESSFTILDSFLTPEVLKYFRPRAESRMLDRDEYPIYKTSDTPLSIAANAGLVKFCRDKIRAGADLNENEGRALQAAMKGLREDVVEMFLEYNLVIRDCHIIDALRCMHLSTVLAMLKRVARGPIVLTNIFGQTIKPLYAIASTMLPWDSRGEDIFRYFLQQGENINDISGPQGTALHGAIYSGFVIDMKTLIRRLDFMLRCGADIDSQGPGIPDDLDHPLDFAVKIYSWNIYDPQILKVLEVLEFLIDRGAKSANLDMIKERIQYYRIENVDYDNPEYI